MPCMPKNSNLKIPLLFNAAKKTFNSWLYLKILLNLL